MGLLEFNVGELVTRLTRGLRVRGRVPLAIDDSVVGVVKLADLTRPPYRLGEQLYRGLLSTIPAVAAEYSIGQIVNNSREQIVLETLEVFNRGATIISIGSLWGAVVPGTNFATWTSEPTGLQSAVFGILPGVQVGYGSTPVAPVPTSESPFYVTLQGNNAADNRWRWENLELVIPPGRVLTLFGSAVNQAFGMSAVLRASQLTPP